MPDCIEDGCGANLSVTAAGKLRMDAVIAALACNGIGCFPVGASPDFPDAFGLFMTEDDPVIQAGTMPDGGVGWGPFDVSTFPVGVPVPVAAFAAAETFPNDNDCRIANVISTVTGREVRYDGPPGAWFRVSNFANIGGIGFLPQFSIDVDLRFVSTAGGAHSEARPQGSAVSGRLINPGGSFTYEYRTFVVNLGTVAAGSMIQSPGLTWCHWSMTN